MQIELTAQGWMENGKGCHPADSWNPVTYSKLKGSYESFGHGEPPVGVIPGLSSVQLTVRSSVDPFIDASELCKESLVLSEAVAAVGRTNDSGNFGSTSKEELVVTTHSMLNVTELQVGLVLIGVALLLSIPLIAHVYTVRTSQQIELLSVDV